MLELKLNSVEHDSLMRPGCWRCLINSVRMSKLTPRSCSRRWNYPFNWKFISTPISVIWFSPHSECATITISYQLVHYHTNSVLRITKLFAVKCTDIATALILYSLRIYSSLEPSPAADCRPVWFLFSLNHLDISRVTSASLKGLISRRRLLRSMVLLGQQCSDVRIFRAAHV